jgi:hypothetical protein
MNAKGASSVTSACADCICISHLSLSSSSSSRSKCSSALFRHRAQRAAHGAWCGGWRLGLAVAVAVAGWAWLLLQMIGGFWFGASVELEQALLVADRNERTSLVANLPTSWMWQCGNVAKMSSRVPGDRAELGAGARPGGARGPRTTSDKSRAKFGQARPTAKRG